MNLREKQYVARLERSHEEWKKSAEAFQLAGIILIGDILCGQAFTLGQRIADHRKMYMMIDSPAREESFQAGALVALEIWADELMSDNG